MRRLLIALPLLLICCVSADVTFLTVDNKPRPPVPLEQVRVFLSEGQIPGPFEAIALLNTHGDAGLTNTAQLIEAARKKAASIGANGIVLGSIQEPDGGERLAAKTVSPYLSGDRRGVVLAIRFANE